MRTLLILIIIFSSTLINSQTNKYMDKAKELSKKFIVIDTHIDLPLRLKSDTQDISKKLNSGDIDYVRAKEGGLDAAFMSIYIPPKLQGTPQAKEYADNLISIVEKIVKDFPDKFNFAKSTQDVLNNFNSGLISLPMGMENGAPIESIELLKEYFQKGIRYVTLAHGKWNHICDSSYDPERKWHGLSPFGKELIIAMNKIGMIIDISHVSDETFYQVIELSKTPVIASHSSCRFFTPGFERNMSDDMIKALAKNGGVIQINFGSDFISQNYRVQTDEQQKHVREFIEHNHLKNDDPEVKKYISEYKKEHPIIFASVSDVVNHIDHVVKLVGIDFVGLGSDFDGVGDSLPTGLKDASMYPNLIAELLKRGYSEQDIEKICGKNLLRVWKQIEDYSKTQE